jgi:hypothetical protein
MDPLSKLIALLLFIYLFFKRLLTSFFFLFSQPSPFSDSEKDYIYQWVSGHQNYDVIRWEHLQVKIQERYGKFRLRNVLKRQWNHRRRQILRQDSFDETEE